MTHLDDFLTTLPPDADVLRADATSYVAWQEGRGAAAFEPSGDDDVEVRNYLLHLKLAGVPRRALGETVRSLQHLYGWLKEEGRIAYDPFDFFEFNRPFLTRQQIRRREDNLPADRREREIVRLRALNAVTESLNQSLDASEALNAALSTLLDVMGLQTGWVFMLRESERSGPLATAPFLLTAATGLPHGLEREGRRFLCQSPDCHCQHLLREGRLTRAVNIVECTRLQDSAKAEGDNRDLYFHASLPLFVSGTPVGVINLATEEWQFLTAADLQFLSVAGNQISAALERARLYERLRTQERRLSQELEMARQVQASLLPETLPPVSGYALGAYWAAAREIAGDFYDVFALPDDRWGLLIADVAGKGAPAALYMAMVRSLIQAGIAHHTHPAPVLLELNTALAAHAETGMFVTVFYGILDPASGLLTFANAGHNPPLLRRADGALQELRAHGPLLGVLAEIDVPDALVTLAPGDSLLLFTDGLIDGLNPEDELYGRERLLAAVAKAPPGAVPLLEHVLADVSSFTGPTSQADDMTMLVLSREDADSLPDNWQPTTDN